MKELKQFLVRYANKETTITLKDEKDNIHVFDYTTLDSDEQSDIDSYYLNNEIIPLVESGVLIPFGVLGLVHHPENFQEMSHNGILFVDCNNDNAIAYFNNNGGDALECIADHLEDLIIHIEEPQPIEESKSVYEMEIEELNGPFYKDKWDTLIDLYRKDANAEAFEIAEVLHQDLMSNGELQKMRALLCLELGKTDQAIEIAQDLAIMGMQGEGELEFLGSVQIKAQAYAEALITGNELLDLVDDSKSKMKSYAYAIVGIALYYLGNTVEGIEKVELAKKYNVMIGVKYPEIRSVK